MKTRLHLANKIKKHPLQQSPKALIGFLASWFEDLRTDFKLDLEFKKIGSSNEKVKQDDETNFVSFQSVFDRRLHSLKTYLEARNYQPYLYVRRTDLKTLYSNNDVYANNFLYGLLPLVDVHCCESSKRFLLQIDRPTKIFTVTCEADAYQIYLINTMLKTPGSTLNDGVFDVLAYVIETLKEVVLRRYIEDKLDSYLRPFGLSVVSNSIIRNPASPFFHYKGERYCYIVFSEIDDPHSLALGSAKVCIKKHKNSIRFSAINFLTPSLSKKFLLANKNSEEIKAIVLDIQNKEYEVDRCRGEDFDILHVARQMFAKRSSITDIQEYIIEAIKTKTEQTYTENRYVPYEFGQNVHSMYTFKTTDGGSTYAV